MSNDKPAKYFRVELANEEINRLRAKLEQAQARLAEIMQLMPPSVLKAEPSDPVRAFAIAMGQLTVAEDALAYSLEHNRALREAHQRALTEMLDAGYYNATNILEAALAATPEPQEGNRAEIDKAARLVIRCWYTADETVDEQFRGALQSLADYLAATPEPQEGQP